MKHCQGRAVWGGFLKWRTVVVENEWEEGRVGRCPTGGGFESMEGLGCTGCLPQVRARFDSGMSTSWPQVVSGALCGSLRGC